MKTINNNQMMMDFKLQKIVIMKIILFNNKTNKMNKFLIQKIRLKNKIKNNHYHKKNKNNSKNYQKNNKLINKSSKVSRTFYKKNKIKIIRLNK